MQQRKPSVVAGVDKVVGMAFVLAGVGALLVACGLKGPLVPAKPATAASSSPAASAATSR